MSPFNENLAEKYGLTGNKLQEFHQALNELFEAYENDDEDYQFLYGEFINVIKNFGIDDDKIGYLVKDLYDYNEHRDLITAFSMSATINGDYSDKFYDIYERIMRFEYDDSDDRDDEAETPWDLKDL